MKRNVYLAMKGLQEARELFFSRFGPDRKTDIEEVATESSLERITAEPLFAKISSPQFHAAAMDGIAVRAEDTYGTNERNPGVLEIDKNAWWVNTGHAIPEGSNAVIMIEKIHQLNDQKLEIRAPAYPWQHIRKVGEDIVATQLLLPRNHKIRSYDVGACISAGIFSLKVRQKPKVAIIPTGSELVAHRDVTDPDEIGKDHILEYNSHILSGLVKECDGIPVVYDIIPDKEELIREALENAVNSDADLVIINAGSSAGSKDFTAHLIKETGEILVHGVAMMPGKPTILGEIKGKPVIGNPGYTVSAILSFKQFASPLLYRMQGRRPPQTRSIRVSPSREIPSKLGIEEFLRVNIGKVGEKVIATPLPRAAGSITTLTRAEGILRIPALSEGITQDEEVEAELLVDEAEILNTIVIIGSHDITIDILADEIRRMGHNIRISSGNVGSMGGLIALRKGTCHMAGSHLLDTETGEYNISYIKRYLKGHKVSVFHNALRDQGLIVAKGNPKGISGIEDVVRDDINFVNRQAGSGTRVLFDFKIGRLGISRDEVKGYDHEEYTHMAVAVDVLSGTADYGMGIYAAAKALNLDFVPVEREQYDFIVPSSILSNPNMRLVMEIISSEGYRKRVSDLGGYDPALSGQLWKEIEC